MGFVMRRVVRMGAVGILAATVFSVIGSGITTDPAPASATSANPMVAVGTSPTLPRAAHVIGSASSTQVLHLSVFLGPRDPAALRSFVRQISTPGQPRYHDYVTPAQFGRDFGATTRTLSLIETTLHREGLKVGSADVDRMSIPASATVSAVDAVFHVAVQKVRLNSGRVALSNTTAPLVPASIAPYVKGILGLSSVDQLQPEGGGTPAGGPGIRPAIDRHSSVLSDAATAAPSSSSALSAALEKQLSPAALAPHASGPNPCSAVLNVVHSQENNDFYYPILANVMAGYYDLSPLYGEGDLGANASTALFEVGGYSAGDIATYQSCYKTNASVKAVPVDGGPGVTEPNPEATLDIEVLAGLAPDTRIQVYEGNETGNFNTELINVLKAIVDGDSSQVISVSYGLCEAGTTKLFGDPIFNSWDALAQQAAAQGQSLFVASGDTGSESCEQLGYDPNSLGVSFPAADPYVTAVGGTTNSAEAYVDSDHQTSLYENVWNEGCAVYPEPCEDDPDVPEGASGGGVSSVWTMPWYQTSATPGVINSYSSGTPCGAAGETDCREVPDVSADADGQTGYPMYQKSLGGWVVSGGTSAASPMWASVVDLIDSRCSTGTVGFANPALYQIAANDPGDLIDVTQGNNDVLAIYGGTYPATVGYDMATGLGTPQAAALSSNLCPAATTPGPPRVVSAVGGNGKAMVRFSSPFSDGGSAITSYTVTATDKTNSANGGQQRTGTSSPITITGLTPGDRYTFTVSATSNTGTGAASRASNAVFAAVVPGPPTGVRASSDLAHTSGTGSSTVTFTDPSNGGSAITGYIATCTSSNHGVTRSAGHAGSAATSITIGSLSTGKTYHCAVEATNAVGAGSTSESNAVIEGAPGAPTDVEASVVGGKIRVSFKLGPNNGSVIEDQSAVCSSSDHGATGTGTRSGGAAGPIVVGSLTNGKTYTCSVQAKNARGSGVRSSPSEVVVT
jgi:subtilase family serine protease